MESDQDSSARIISTLTRIEEMLVSMDKKISGMEAKVLKTKFKTTKVGEHRCSLCGSRTTFTDNEPGDIFDVTWSTADCKHKWKICAP